MKKKCALVKKVIGHLKEDTKEFKKGIKSDKMLTKQLKAVKKKSK